MTRCLAGLAKRNSRELTVRLAGEPADRRAFDRLLKRQGWQVEFDPQVRADLELVVVEPLDVQLIAAARAVRGIPIDSRGDSHLLALLGKPVGVEIIDADADVIHCARIIEIVQTEKAVAEANALLAVDPNDPFFLELKGQILLEGGKPAEAIPVLRQAVQRSGEAPMIAAMLGHALVETEDPKNFTEAKQILKVAVLGIRPSLVASYFLSISSITRFNSAGIGGMGACAISIRPSRPLRAMWLNVANRESLSG